jgi:CHAT domain-containing protein/tetratricopeptide (TPR) repeat protein
MGNRHAAFQLLLSRARQTMAPLLALSAFSLTPAAAAEMPDLPVMTALRPSEEVRPLEALLHAGANEEAIDRAARALSLVKDPEGTGASQAADLLEVILDAHLAMGEASFDGLVGETNRILALRERILGPNDPRVATILWRRFWITAMNRPDIPRQREDAERALAIIESALGSEHPDNVDFLRIAGMSCIFTGDLDQALDLLRRCVSIGEKTRGPSDPSVIECVGLPALVSYMKSDPVGALAAHQAAIERLEAGGDPGAYPSANLWSDLGWALVENGRIADARAALDRGKALLERAVGPASPRLARLLYRGAQLELYVDDFPSARRDFERALAIYRQHSPSRISIIPVVLIGLADTYMRLGDWASASSFAAQALDDERRRLGKGGEVATPALDIMGFADLVRGDLESARVHLEEAAGGTRREYFNSGVEAVTAFALLSTCYSRLGRLTESNEALTRAVGLLEEGMRTNVPLVIDTLHWPLAQHALSLGPPSLIPILERVLNRLETMYGEFSIPVGENAETLGTLQYRQGNEREALRWARIAERAGRERLRQVSGLMEERLALTYSAVRPGARDLLVTLAVVSNDPDTRREAYQALALSRALAFDALAGRHRLVVRSTDPLVRELLESLATARKRFAALSIAGLAKASESREGRAVDSARREVDRLERALGEHGQPIPAEVARDDQEDWLPRIEKDSLLVSYFRYRPTGGDPSRGAPEYAALVAGSDGPIRAVALGPAEKIDRAIALWRDAVTVPPRGSLRQRRSAESTYRAVALRLADLLWRPLGIDLDGSRTVFVVPDGQIHLVPLATLVGPAGTYLQEHRAAIHYLGSERDLEADRPANGTALRSLLAVGGPAFDGSAGNPGPRETYRGSRAACDDRFRLEFGPLPGALREVNEIDRLWKGAGGNVLRLTGTAASEGDVKRLAARRQVIHFATHAFVLGEDCERNSTLPDAGGSRVPDENPLLLSFLALAGANRHGEDQTTEDGILTAEEIASLDLSGVEWAVLSACDTARGPVLAGEGVLGLRRAFAVAGAATTIMSLWPVEDDDARQWMVSLYKHRLDGTTTAQAVHAAGLDILKSRRARGLDTHPSHWGAFVAAGDWR